MPQRPNFDLYEALEVTCSANPQEIRDSYRRVALIHHPDKNPGDAAATERFQRISLAHEHLSDPTLRQAYDNPSTRAQGFPDGCSDYENFYGYTYSFSSEDRFARIFRADIEELRRRAATSRAEYEAYRSWFQAEWKKQEAIRKKHRDKKQRKDEEAAERQQARANAKKDEEEEKQRLKDMRAKQEKVLQEKRWSDMNATTEAEKRRICSHSDFWPKEQQKRKSKCESCGKKGGMTAYKCPHCSLLVCQLCLNKLVKRTT